MPLDTVASFLTTNSTIFFLIVIWSLPWKGIALWKAAQRSDQWWFIALLVINTIGILEILYILIWSKRPKHLHNPNS